MAKYIGKTNIDSKDLSKVIEEVNEYVAKIGENISAADRMKLGASAMKEMKDLVSKGISPVLEAGRFPGYLKPEKYPGRGKNYKKGKRNRPINLKLSGDFMGSLENWIGPTGNPTIGFKNELSKKKEEGHRKGSSKKHPEITKRPVIPNKNENFALRITKVISDGLTKLVEEYYKKALK